MKKRLVSFLMLALCVFFPACGKKDTGTKKDFIYVAASASVTDDSFLSLSYSAFSSRSGRANVSAMTTAAGSDTAATAAAAVAQNPSLVWGAEYSLGATLTTLAAQNPDIIFGVTDYVPANTENMPANLVTIEFKSEEAAFLAGYAAARTDGISTLGFIGGKDTDVINNMMNGFFNGAKYAAANTTDFSKTLTCLPADYVGSFDDEATAKTKAAAMYAAGADVIFHAAGSGGFGVIDAAADVADDGKYVVGVDYDQSDYNPDAKMLTSVLKKVDTAIGGILDDVINGKSVGGKHHVFNIKNEGVGITAGLIALDVFLEVGVLMAKIGSGAINVLDEIQDV